MEMNAARIIGLARKTFSNQEPNVKEMLAILCGNWVGGAVQNAIANTLGTLFGVRHFGDLKSFLAHFAEAHDDILLRAIAANAQMQLVAGFLLA
jgi:hypothetical protein